MIKKHIIQQIQQGSIADQMGIEVGDRLLRINGKEIQDIFDYNYSLYDEFLVLEILKKNGEEWELEIEKEYEQLLGMEFGEGLMDDYQSCRNKCMFCFIDQMPPNMRETLYFKDDDARLSFLQGNYITLTNMSEKDIKRIIDYRLEPINISIHTMNPELRCHMLKNRFAGDALKKIDELYHATIHMNSQIVLCKGYNDEEELDSSIKQLSYYYPYMQSLSIVPVGLTKYRDNLTPLKTFQTIDAKSVLHQIHKWQAYFLEKYNTHFVYASDEWYLNAQLPIPEESYYEGYGQIENGVGMVRSLIDEVTHYLNTMKLDNNIRKTISLATGVLAAPIIKQIIKEVQIKYPNIIVYVYAIQNNFFGTEITVAGLLTGQDIVAQLKGKELGEYLMLPDVLLRDSEDILLDDWTILNIEQALQTRIFIVQSDGVSFVDTVIGNFGGIKDE